MTAVTELLDQLARAIPALPGAACRGKEAIMDVPTALDRQAVARAQAVCATCPALQPCTEWLAGVPPYRLPTGVVAGRFVKPPWLRPLPEPKPKQPTKTDRATDWLVAYLAAGPVISTALRADAAAAGIDMHNLVRARRRLGVQLQRLTGVHGGQRWWTLPHNPNRKRNTMDTLDNNMTLPARAGDTRRMWSALLHYQAVDMAGLDNVMADAHNIGRGHHLVFAAFEYLADALQLDKHPERVDEIRQEIARLHAVENSDTTGEDTDND